MMDLVENEIYIQAPWGKLAALTWGSPSDPPVLLCHGKIDVCSSFRPLVSLLPRTFYYVSLELPGNGKSDPFPINARYSTIDYVPSLKVVKDHFKWDHFIFIGHSMGGFLGKCFDLVYPGVITRMVELDPIAAYDVWAPEDFATWYQRLYGEFYQQGRYGKYTSSSLDNAPKHTYEKALSLMMEARELSEDAVKHVLGRALEPAGDGLYRFTFDPRQKDIARLPLSPEYMEKLYTSVKTPILCVLSETMTGMGLYNRTPFVRDARSWPHGNYRVRVVAGPHDLHISSPQLIAQDITQFITDTKAKL